jgi:hypothetical protein
MNARILTCSAITALTTLGISLPVQAQLCEEAQIITAQAANPIGGFGRRSGPQN